MAVPEEDVLKAKDPSIKDENQWEEFLLKDVEVLDSNGSLVSLLDADESTPVTVTGSLGTLEPTQRHCLLWRYYRAEPVEVSNVVRYAYGQYEDGELALWAAGNAGWFRIQPAETYKPIYQDMLDAINVFYFIADRYSRNESKKKIMEHPSAETVFEEYAAQKLPGIGSARAAASHIYQYRTFLIAAMLRGKEAIDWSGTPLYLHLERKFRTDFSSLRLKLEGPKGNLIRSENRRRGRPRSTTVSSVGSAARNGDTETESPRPFACQACGKRYKSSGGLQYHLQHSRLCDQDISILSDKSIHRTTSGRFSRQTSFSSPVSQSKPRSMGRASIISFDGPADEHHTSSHNTGQRYKITLIMRVIRSIAALRQQHMSVRSLGSLLFEHFQLESTSQAVDLIRAQAMNLKLAIDGLKRPKIDWEKTRLYRELANSRISDEKLKDAKLVRLRWRDDITAQNRKSTSDHSDGSDGEGILGQKGYKGKSVLRPKTTRYSNKGAARRGSLEDEVYSDDQGSRTPTKRKRSSRAELHNSKRTASNCDEMEVDVPTDSELPEQGNDSEAENDLEIQSTTSDLPLRLKPDPFNELEPPLFTVVEVPAPFFTPQGPGDTWTCVFDGCMHKVYAATGADSKDLIEEHYQKHAAEERINVVLKEQRPYLPVGNLLKRIREIAEQGQVFPSVAVTKTSLLGAYRQPIERRY